MLAGSESFNTTSAPWKPRQQGFIAFAGIKRQQILGGGQHDIGGVKAS